MEAVTSSQEGEVSPAATTTVEESGLFAEEDFEEILDVPFMTVNRIGHEYFGEVVLSGDDVVDRARVQKVLDTGAEHGQHVYARKHGEYGTILIFFTANA
jgi:hypothetical protein